MKTSILFYATLFVRNNNMYSDSSWVCNDIAKKKSGQVRNFLGKDNQKHICQLFTSS